MSDLAWLMEGAAVVIVRQRRASVERLPGTVYSVRPELSWSRVVVRANHGPLWGFDITDSGVVGVQDGLDAYGYPTHLEPGEA